MRTYRFNIYIWGIGNASDRSESTDSIWELIKLLLKYKKNQMSVTWNKPPKKKKQ